MDRVPVLLPARQGFGHAVAGADAAAPFAQTWMLLLGAGCAERQRLHRTLLPDDRRPQ